MERSAKYSIKVNGQEHKVEADLQSTRLGTIDDQPYELDLVGSEERGYNLIQNLRSHEVQVIDADYSAKTFVLRINQNTYHVEAADRFDLLLKELGMEHLAASALTDLKAPMPGKVLGVKVEAGQEVSKGDPLVVLEAMKMENVLKAEADAVIKEINCEIGTAVEKNQILVAFES